MNKIRRIKIGIIFILLGIGIPLILYFFQDDGVLLEIPINKVIERKLNPNEIEEIKSMLSEIQERIISEMELRGTDLEFILNYFPDKEIKEKQKKEELKLYATWLLERIKGKDFLKKITWTIKQNIEIKISFRKIIGLGIFLIFIGLGLIIFSLFPK